MYENQSTKSVFKNETSFVCKQNEFMLSISVMNNKEICKRVRSAG